MWKNVKAKKNQKPKNHPKPIIAPSSLTYASVYFFSVTSLLYALDIKMHTENYSLLKNIFFPLNIVTVISPTIKNLVLLCKQCFYGCVLFYHNLLKSLLMIGHSGCFLLEAIINSTTGNIFIHEYWSVFLIVFQKMEFGGRRVGLFQNS